MKQLKSAVIGGGYGGNLSMKALMQSNYFELAAMADMRESARKDAEKDYPGIKTYESAEALFNDCFVDVVCVSTYPPSHEEITMSALKLPLTGILVEKPLGHTAASGRRILDAVKAKKIPMAVPHGALVQETPIEVMKQLKAGVIGDLKLVEIQFDKWDIINAGIHWVNLFVNLTGLDPIDYVMAICEGSARTYRDGMQVETTAVTYVQTKSGIRLVMNCGDNVLVNADGPEAHTLFRLIGTKGQIEFRGWERGYRIMNAEHPDFDKIDVPALAVDGHRAHLENMYGMIGNTPNYSVAESSLTALEICEAAYLSSKRQCKVAFPYEKFVIPKLNDREMGVPYPGTGGGRDGRLL
ncbi:MAG: Gfo/Idh/MocA family oxidoreductase [Oscillospiraceae bacterium]|nr:Gfo/Idh/MocA family oxidoreductase [Oscillospiraceae bacterium]